MNGDQHRASVKVYQLKVSLRDISPMIWRRLLITSNTTMAHLHAILQTALGWEDIHLHRFRIYGKAYGIYRAGGIIFDDNPYKVALSDFKLRAGERFSYEYDLGDSWRHDIRLERILLHAPNKTYPLCTGGAGDCPPEDCGGPAGYRAYLDERCSWQTLFQAHADIELVARRLLDFAEGGPQPTYADTEFMDALERMQARLLEVPTAFKRRSINRALRQLTKETLCACAPRWAGS